MKTPLLFVSKKDRKRFHRFKPINPNALSSKDEEREFNKIMKIYNKNIKRQSAVALGLAALGVGALSAHSRYKIKRRK